MKAFKILAVILTALTLGFSSVSCSSDILDIDGIDNNTPFGYTDLKDNGKELSYAAWMTHNETKLITSNYYGYDSKDVITSIKVVQDCGSAANANELYEEMKGDPEVVGKVSKSGNKVTFVADMSKHEKMTVEDVKAEYRAVVSEINSYKK